MLRRGRAPTIPATLTIKGQGESVTFNITYHNRTQSEVAAKTAEAYNTETGEGGVVGLVLFLVESWETEYELTSSGVQDMEDDRPGMILAIVQGFHDARGVARAKN